MTGITTTQFPRDKPISRTATSEKSPGCRSGSGAVSCGRRTRRRRSNKVLAHNQDELRRTFAKQKVEAAKHSAGQRNAFHHAIELGHKALEHLGNQPPAIGSGLSSLISLTTPFLIWEWPHPSPDQLRDSHIEALKSWAKILIGVPAYSFDNDEGSDSKEFSFYFLWENNSDFLAVAKVFSVLSLTGTCEAWANSGVFSGDTMGLSIQASLFPISYWLPLPSGGTINNLRVFGDPLQNQTVLNLTSVSRAGLCSVARVIRDHKSFPPHPSV